jgi:hypothetical protein
LVNLTSPVRDGTGALVQVNYALPTRLSDHDPISVDLPFAEPASLQKSD